MLAYGFTPEEARELKKLANAKKLAAMQAKQRLQGHILLMQYQLEMRQKEAAERVLLRQRQAAKRLLDY